VSKRGKHQEMETGLLSRHLIHGIEKETQKRKVISMSLTFRETQ
jgi:hypothetical protein